MSSGGVKKAQMLQMLWSVGRAVSPIVPIAETASNVIDMAQALALLRQKATSKNRSITSWTYEAVQAAAILDRATAYVERVMSARFPDLVGAMRDKMVAEISQQVADNPRTRELLTA